MYRSAFTGQNVSQKNGSRKNNSHDPLVVGFMLSVSSINTAGSYLTSLGGRDTS